MAAQQVGSLDEVRKRMLEKSLTLEKYKGEPYKCWGHGKELRLKIYQDYARAHELGGLRVSGSTWSFLPVPMGLGDDVYWLVGEPFSASTAHIREISIPNLEAKEAHGWARDICGYVGNYLGCIYRDVYPFGGPWPKSDLDYQMHICCTHAKWYQASTELEGNTPLFIIDVSAGPNVIGPGKERAKEHRLKYVADQLLESIDALDKLADKKWGRRFDDEKFIKACQNDFACTSMWSDICCLNQAVPAPMDEKSMFAWFNIAGIGRAGPHGEEVMEFYQELYDEAKDRIARGIAAVPHERCRLFGDCPPPWGDLDIYRLLESYGVVSIGSFYSFTIMGVWEFYEENGETRLRGRKTPKQLGIDIKTREDACRWLADWYLSKPYWNYVCGAPEFRNDFLKLIAKLWKCDAALLHYNRGCELTTMYAPEVKIALMEAGIPVATYEASHADPRDFDGPRVQAQIESFMESLGLKKLTG